MGSRSTNSSLQTAPDYQVAGGESTSTSHTVTSLDELSMTSQAVVSMSGSVSSPSVYSLQNGATRDVADRSAVLALPLLDQPFIVGPGFSPVPAKLVAQIVAGKYIGLSDLLAVNLVQREPEP